MKQKYKHLMTMMGNEDRVGREKEPNVCTKGEGGRRRKEESRDEREREESRRE
jgi:hypothetical protein